MVMYPYIPSWLRWGRPLSRLQGDFGLQSIRQLKAGSLEHFHDVSSENFCWWYSLGSLSVRVQVGFSAIPNQSSACCHLSKGLSVCVIFPFFCASEPDDHQEISSCPRLVLTDLDLVDLSVQGRSEVYVDSIWVISFYIISCNPHF
jgi:hypothetical protein